MPSGLTADIYDNKDLSLRGFALNCVKHFGAGYVATEQNHKEMPLYEPPVLEVDDYHTKRIEEIKYALKKLLNIEYDPDAIEIEYNKYVAERKKANADYQKRNQELRQRYQLMLAKVNAWNVDEQYEPLKKYMLEKLDESMNFDCHDGVIYSEDFPTKEQWLKDKIEDAIRELKYHISKYKAECKRIDEYNAYLKGLYEAIDNVEPRLEKQE